MEYEGIQVKDELLAVESAFKSRNYRDYGKFTCQAILKLAENYLKYNENQLLYFILVPFFLLNFCSCCISIYFYFKYKRSKEDFGETLVCILLIFDAVQYLIAFYPLQQLKTWNSVISKAPRPEIKAGQLLENSRFLSLGNNLFLITGGGTEKSKRKCLRLDTSALVLYNIPSLSIGRKRHAMTWIDGYPAVISGIISESVKTTSVEILMNDKWIKGPSINYSRESPCAVSMGKTTIVCGDYGSLHFEMYNNGVWKSLLWTIEFSYNSMGIVCVGTSLLLFGGAKGKDQKLVILLDLSAGKTFDLPYKLENSNVFFQNSVCVEKNIITALGRNGLQKSTIDLNEGLFDNRLYLIG